MNLFVKKTFLVTFVQISLTLVYNEKKYKQ